VVAGYGYITASCKLIAWIFRWHVECFSFDGWFDVVSAVGCG